MKRMSEVFQLPVKKGDGFSCRILYSGQGLPLATFCFEDDSQHAAHAINHVDALADALSALIKLVDDKEDADMFRNSAYKESVQALAAYRGDK